MHADIARSCKEVIHYPDGSTFRAVLDRTHFDAMPLFSVPVCPDRAHGSHERRYSSVRVVEDTQARPVCFVNRCEATITTNSSKGIATYARLSQQEYLSVCYFVALAQLRALRENPLLEPEDMECQSEKLCLFSWHPEFYEYAEVFANRLVCPGCFQFYLAACAEREILVLRNLLEQYSESSNHRECAFRPSYDRRR